MTSELIFVVTVKLVCQQIKLLVKIYHLVMTKVLLFSLGVEGFYTDDRDGPPNDGTINDSFFFFFFYHHHNC